jgi:GMP synthase-like glutamine amidotransferase
MNPVAIFCFAPHEGPGHLSTYLSARGIPWCIVKAHEGEAFPPIADLSGVAMMGGPMSVNDDLPWIRPMLDLIRSCVAADVPIIGHCLGGQLLAKALGGTVTRNRVKEIGWGAVEVTDPDVAREWGPVEHFLSFHWHGERFTIPEGAARIWASAHCENQAFVYGPHFAMQCHIEMTAEMIERWIDSGADEIEHNLSRSPAVQTPYAMREDMEANLAALNGIAESVYERWTRGLVGLNRESS